MLGGMGTAPFGSCAAGPYVGRAPLAIARGALADAADLIQTAHELSDNLGDVQTSALVQALHAQLEIERARPVQAVELARESVRLTADSEDEAFMPQCCAIGIRASADRRDASRGGASDDAETAQQDARAFLDAAETALERRSARGAPLSPYPAAFMVLCRAELSRFGQSDAKLWRQAADGFDASPDAYLAAYCRWREAEALLEARGSRARAGECLSEAAQRSRALRSSPLTARIEELAARTRIELRDEESPQLTARSSAAAELGLTARESEILGQLTAGCSDKEIAETLFISKKTVRVHVTNVLRKLQVANRVEAGKIGHQLGLRGTPV
jgi:DNA-binding NarL/FixJ family response regulator